MSYRYTEHSTVGLAQQWDQLDQLCMRMQHNLEQQIEARNRSGVSEDALREFSMMFKWVGRWLEDYSAFPLCVRVCVCLTSTTDAYKHSFIQSTNCIFSFQLVNSW